MAAGEIDVALALVRQLAPGLLDGDPHIHFRLQCQKFAEMVRRGARGGRQRGQLWEQTQHATAGTRRLSLVTTRPLEGYATRNLPVLIFVLPICPHFYVAQIKAGLVAEAIEYGRTHVSRKGRLRRTYGMARLGLPHI